MQSDFKAWSLRQSALLSNCPRSYYLARKSPGGTDEHQRIISLRALTGVVVHSSISYGLSSWRDGIEPKSVECQNHGLSLLSSIWAERESRIVEIRNGLRVDDLKLEAISHSVCERIGTFFRMFWPQLRRREYVIHEKLESFDIGEIRVYVKADLVTRDGSGRILIHDWKTSRFDDSETEALQMSVYAAWAHQRFMVPIDCIMSQVVNLQTGHVNQKSYSSTTLDEVSRRVESEMQLIDGLSKGSGFYPAPQQDRCSSCPFMKSCEDGRSVMTADDGFALRYDYWHES